MTKVTYEPVVVVTTIDAAVMQAVMQLKQLYDEYYDWHRGTAKTSLRHTEKIKQLGAILTNWPTMRRLAVPPDMANQPVSYQVQQLTAARAWNMSVPSRSARLKNACAILAAVGIAADHRPEGEFLRLEIIRVLDALPDPDELPGYFQRSAAA